MAAVIRLGSAPGASFPPPPLPVQLLPCRIGSDGPAPVASFLRPQPGPGGELTASFRGRRLAGRDLQLPAGYRGLILRQEETQAQTPPGGRKELRVPLSPSGSFSSIREWFPELLPAGGLQGALQWAPIAQAIHSPVPESDEEEEP